jgi:L-amino acid N-acyltransferase YncA
VIRQASPADANDILTIYAPFVRTTYVTFETQPPSRKEMETRIARSHVWLVYEESGRSRGFAYAATFHPRDAYRWSTEVSIYVEKDAQGQGLGRKLAERLIEDLSGKGFVNALAGIALPNPSSIALFESLGFRKIAHQENIGFKLGAWWDVGWWQLQLRKPTVPPPELSFTPCSG